MNARYKNPDNDHRGVWMAGDLSVKTYSANYDYPITTPSGRIVNPPVSRSWRTSKENFEKLKADNRIWFGKDGNNVPTIKRFLNEVKDGLTTLTFWLSSEAGTNLAGKNEIKALFADESTELFTTPKPEALLKRIIEISTKENDLVLDFFAGSGTTLAVAHKMNRRYVGIEQMDYIETITKERLKKVVNGEQGGVSKQVGWNPKEQNPEDNKRKNQFMYCELMPLNILYKKEIIEASKEQELEKLYKILKEKAFIDYRVDIQEILKDKDFQALDFDNKKAFLLQSLDSNMDYVLFGDLEDKDLQLSKELIALNKAFYEKVKKS